MARIRKGPWWQTTLLVIGFIAAVSVMVILFLPVGDLPGEVFTDHAVPPLSSTAFATVLSTLINSPLNQGGTITILHNGDEFLPALIESIDGAQRTINFSVFIWREGQFSDQVLDALLRAQKRGVTVRVLLDGFGAMDIPDKAFDPLIAAGGRMEKFRAPQFGKLTRYHKRNHRRSIVIDGETGFTGGMAVSDTWLGHGQDPEHWRDMMFRVTGPLAASLQSAFAGAWASSSGEMLVAQHLYMQATDPPEKGVERFIHHVNSPAADDLSMLHFFALPAIAAQRTVYIATPYFIPDKHLKSTLMQRAQAGLDVRLLVPGENIDNALVRLSAQNHYEELLEAGVRIYEYQPTFLHSKYAVFDGHWSVIGTANLNTRSRQVDEENVFGILDSDFGGRLNAVFQSDLAEAHEITVEEWSRRNRVVKLMQRLAQVLDKQS